MNYQVERIRAIQGDRVRAAERYRPARMLPMRASVWTRLAQHLSPRRDNSAGTTDSEGGHASVGVGATSTHVL